MVLAYGRADALPVVALRFFTVYGPRQRPDMAFHRFIQAMSKDAPLPLFGDGSQTRDFTYVDDVVMACLRAAESPSAGIVINIGGGSRVALRETVAYLGEILGKTPRVQVHERQMGDAPHTQAATARATQLLDWQPRTHWREGLLRQVEWQLAAEGQPRATRRFTLGSKHAAPRLLLYGHDTYGLGHLRRNLVIAAGLTQAFPDLSVLLLTGSPVAQQFDMPANVDYVKLPSVVKVADESYQARTLNVDAGEITRMRTAIIREAVNGFAPDVVLVDHAPAGMKGEMLPALRDLRAQRPWTRIALGLRDIVDDPERVRATWHAQGIYDILNELYDAVFVYGMPEVLDVARAYELPANVAARLHYCGYLARERSLADVAARRAQLAPHGERIVLVTAGGGGDGDAIFTTYMTAILQGRLPTKTVSVINTGPFLDTETRNALQRVVADHPQVHLLEFTTDLPSYMEAADLVVCMGGYNTICEVISVGARALVLPRTAPRMEQAIRARRFAELGLVHVLPDVPLTPDLLATEVTRLLTQSLPDEMAINTAILHFAEKGGLGGNVALRDGIKMLLASASPAAMGEARM